MTENVMNNNDFPIAPDDFEPEADHAAVVDDEIYVKDNYGNTVKMEVPDDAQDDQA